MSMNAREQAAYLGLVEAFMGGFASELWEGWNEEDFARESCVRADAALAEIKARHPGFFEEAESPARGPQLNASTAQWCAQRNRGERHEQRLIDHAEETT